ncbi:MAG: FAD:protein transferase [Pseudonocardiales bacterium]|nr:FAD:protein transferase [Pseudonocardiales bacterium]
MNGALTLPGRFELTALGTSALLLVTQPRLLDRAAEVLRRELAEIDRVCSRFRTDSEITKLHRAAGRTVIVSPLLAEALDAALRAAAITGGLVDPTVGAAVRALGYDRDFAQVQALESRRGADGGGVDGRGSGGSAPMEEPRPAPGWWRLHWDPAARELLLPRGVSLDLGATAKALAADRAARRAAEVTGCGVLVGLGGDLGMAGAPPEGGWRVAGAADHRDALDSPAQTNSVASGGLATSSTVARAWRHGGRRRHHIVDPRTGDNPAPLWRTVSVAAGSCMDANIASTAAIVLGGVAPDWLASRGLPARLVTETGQVVHTAGWPMTEEGV